MQRLIATISLLWLFTAVAQHPYYYSLNDEVGLPSNEVYCALQDSNGFVWIGCEAGLYRYDGFEFKSYRHPNQNAKAISSLKFDSFGKLWCQNFAGQIYNVTNDELYLFYDARNKIIGHPSFDIDLEGNIYIGLADRIVKLNGEGKELPFIKNQIIVRELIWIEEYKSLFVYSSHKRKFYLISNTEIKEINFLTSSSAPDIVYFNKTINEHYVLYSNNKEGIFYIGKCEDLIEGKSKPQVVSDNNAYCYSINNVQNNLWVTSINGAFTVNSLSPQHLFVGDKISSMFIDRENNYWFTSLENGIHIVPSIESQLINKSNSIIKDQNISSIFFLNDNAILIGTFSGQTFKYDIHDKSIVKFYENENLRYNTVSSIQRVNNDSIIVSRGVLSFMNNDFEIIGEQTYDYLRDFVLIKDTLYFTCSSGAGYFKFNDLRDIDLSKISWYTKVSSRNVEYDSLNQRLWIGFGNGLHYKYQNELLIFLDEGDTLYPTDIKINQGIVWLGTINDGVIGIEDTVIKYRLNQNNILKGNSVSSLFVNDDILVASTGQCINIIFKNENRIEYLDIADGINVKDINVIEANDSLIFLGSNKGLFYLPLNAIRQNKVAPYMRIKQVKISGEIALDLKNLDMNYDDELTILFDAVSLRAREKVVFQYRISKEHSRWIDVPNNTREITISSLLPGENIIELIAINEDGVLNLTEQKIVIYVHAPFWQRWWFYTLIAVLIALVIGLIYQIRIRVIRRQALLKERLIKSQLKSIKAQMNPHFIFNSLNSIQDLILQKDVKNSYQYLNKFSSLMRKVLDSSELDEITLNEELKFLEIYLELEKLRFGYEFNFFIAYDDPINVDKITIPPMLIQPFVENAIKHGLLHKKGDKLVSIRFSMIDNQILKCVISDNGVGRQKSAEIKSRSGKNHNSFATSATQHRVELLNERTDYAISFEIIDDSKDDLPIGTTVVILIKQDKTSPT